MCLLAVLLSQGIVVKCTAAMFFCTVAYPAKTDTDKGKGAELLMHKCSVEKKFLNSFLQHCTCSKGTSDSHLKESSVGPQNYTLLYLSVTMRNVIGNFSGPYSEVRPAKF